MWSDDILLVILRDGRIIDGSKRKGDVDILVVPDLVSGNILGKDLEYLARAQLAGFVMGTNVPIVLTSRSDPPRARVISCAVAALMSSRMSSKSKVS